MGRKQLFWCGMRFAFFVGALSLSLTPLAFAQDRPRQDAFIFATADADRNGRLTQSEFAAAFFPGRKNAALTLQEAFSSADTDGDGYVSRDEFARWFQSRHR